LNDPFFFSAPQLKRDPLGGATICHQGPSQESLVSANELLSSISQPVPELPVADVERAQQHYRDALGFEIGWLYPDKQIGAVSRGNVVIFFRRRNAPFEPAVHWVFAEDLDASYRELKSSGANIVEPLEEKPWGLRQFTVADVDGNRFYFHHD
jgi:uncharacterized glyoxalase superfamily protein PhnB